MVTAMPAPHSSLITATADSSIRFLDVRTGAFMYELKCCTGPAGDHNRLTYVKGKDYMEVGE